MSAKPLLDALFEADRKLREAEAAVLSYPKSEPEADALAREFERAADQAFGLSDAAEASARLARIADLCAQAQGPRSADTLLRILNHPAPEVRVAAGEALRDFAYDRYAEVARAIERAIEQKLSGPALAEVPWILAEIGEPSALPLIGRMLKHPDVEVVASAIEALAELDDPAGAELLGPYVKDRRVVQLEEDDAGYTTTIGELASEALGELSGR
ncbi:MAG TPA: HEAT repeat domain-containing protein [Polyangiales bacterium]